MAVLTDLKKIRAEADLIQQETGRTLLLVFDEERPTFSMSVVDDYDI